jgi:hypothetical protein
MRKLLVNNEIIFFVITIVVGIPGIEPGSLAALVFELLDDTYVHST